MGHPIAFSVLKTPSNSNRALQRDYTLGSEVLCLFVYLFVCFLFVSYQGMDRWMNGWLDGL